LYMSTFILFKYNSGHTRELGGVGGGVDLCVLSISS
jgi:hypothetical protein